MHITSVRQLRGFESATAVVCVESNLANEAMHHEAFLKSEGLSNLCVLRENRNGTPGILSTNASKRTMAQYADSLLMAGLVSFHAKFVSVTSPKKMNADRVREAFIDQMLGYQRIIIPPNNVYGEAKEKYTGKGSGKDDLAIAFQLCLQSEFYFRTSPEKYSHYYRLHNQLQQLQRPRYHQHHQQGAAAVAAAAGSGIQDHQQQSSTQVPPASSR
jgi:hypothetical protein